MKRIIYVIFVIYCCMPLLADGENKYEFDGKILKSINIVLKEISLENINLLYYKVSITSESEFYIIEVKYDSENNRGLRYDHPFGYGKIYYLDKNDFRIVNIEKIDKSPGIIMIE